MVTLLGVSTILGVDQLSLIHQPILMHLFHVSSLPYHHQQANHTQTYFYFTSRKELTSLSIITYTTNQAYLRLYHISKQQIISKWLSKWWFFISFSGSMERMERECDGKNQTMVAHPDSKGWYIHCDGEQYICKDCPSTLEFNVECQQCLFPGATECHIPEAVDDVECKQ